MTQLTHVHRTFEPFRFLSRFTIFPMKIKKGTPPITLSVTHEADPPWRWAPTVVVRFGPLPFGFGVGWWLDSDVHGLREELQKTVAEAEIKAEYDRYQAVNGQIDYDTWFRAREDVLNSGRDPEDVQEVLFAIEGD